MHDVEHGTAGDQVFLVVAVAEVGLTAARGVLEHLVADRVTQAPSDGLTCLGVSQAVWEGISRGCWPMGDADAPMVMVPNGVTKV